MSATGFVAESAVPSDAPLLSELGTFDGQPALLRRLDPVFATSRLAREALEFEAATLARLPASQSLLLGLLDHGRDPEPYLVRAWAPLGTLEDLAACGPLASAEVLYALTWIGSALETLGRLGVAHGDATPQNALVQADGSLRLADAASSRRLFAEGRARVLPADREADARALGRWLADWIGVAPEDELGAEMRRIAAEFAVPVRRLAALRQLAAKQPADSLRIGVGGIPS